MVLMFLNIFIPFLKHYMFKQRQTIKVKTKMKQMYKYTDKPTDKHYKQAN